MNRPPEEEDFQGTDRFLVQRRLGAGSYGVVYRALDRESGSVIALKTLRHGNVEALFRLKREFRALADIAHPNLVAYHELLAHGDQWFFTMELIEGVSFLQFVRGERAAVTAPSDAPTLPADEAADAVAGAGPAGSPDRIRVAIRQAVAGLQTLHRAGQIHRDVKPSNVLVTPEGRLALLDFGLVTDLNLTGTRHSLSIVGTPVYMSPEQGAARPVSAATDWYSLGVMLFEALTGRWPFAGGFIEMMWEKQHTDPPAASALAPGIPEDLNSLCRDLLRREPEARPGAEEILARLGAVQAATYEPTSMTASTSRTPPFLGRERHLSSLRSAFEETGLGRAIVVRLHGPSGAGKTFLARHFLHEVRKSGSVVLSGRCYERESVPYKAVDSLVDALSQYLKKLPADGAAEVVPGGASALARLFPVLRRVDAIAAAEGLAPEVPDSQELRRLGFAALRELLGRIATRHRLVLFLDDLQWGDLDSADLLTDALRPPQPPSLLLIACYRSDGSASSPFLTRFLAANPSEGATDVRELFVGALEPHEARDLSLALLDGREPSFGFAEEIARESGGNPLFLSELVRFGQAGVEPAAGDPAIPDSAGAPASRRRTLEEILRARILDLPGSARRLLEILAVAGRPLRASLARSAAELAEDDGSLALLFAKHLVRARTAGAPDEIVPYHDQIRETAVASLSPETLRSHHRRLASVLEGSPTTDPEALALHFQEAGNPERAADYASVAASRASEALAFDRAARLYRLALELRPESDASARRALFGKLGDALSNAGQGSQAAQAYLDAVAGAPAGEALELKRRAAEQLLISGRIEEGLRTLQTVLDRVGLKLAGSPRAALLSMLYRRLLVRLRGTRFRERLASQVSPDLLTRIDVCWSAAKGMSLADPIRGNDFHSRQLLLALRAGEPYRVARALAMEAGYSAMGGGRTRHRTDRILEAAAALANRIQNPHAMGFTMSVAGIAAGVEGRWKDARELTLKAGAMLREQCRAVAWEIDNSNYYALLSLAFLGQFKELQETLPRLLREAQDRSDLFAATNIRTRLAYLVLLAQDRPREAQEELQQAIEGWSPAGFFLQHWYELLGQVESSLYAGDLAGAWERLAARWPRLEASLFLRVQSVRINSLHLRARTAIAAAASSPEDHGTLCAIAERDAKGIEREATPWGDALGRLLRAGIATIRRDAEAAELLEAAEREFQSAGMALHEAVARRRLGQVRGGAQGRLLVDAADTWMAGQHIRSPERLAAMLAPGLWPP